MAENDEVPELLEALSAQVVVMRLTLHALLDTMSNDTRVSLALRLSDRLERENARMLPTATSDTFQQLVQEGVRALQAAILAPLADHLVAQRGRDNPDAQDDR